MEYENDNIELRSEKVRNLVGQIPPVIIRTGISVIFFVILILLIGTCFFKFDYTIKSIATISQHDKNLIIQLIIPANEMSKIKPGQKVILHFNKIPNLYNEKMTTEIQAVPNILEITKVGGYYTAEILIQEEIKTKSGRMLFIKEETKVNAEVIIGKISLFDQITEPVRTLFSRSL